MPILEDGYGDREVEICLQYLNFEEQPGTGRIGGPEPVVGEVIGDGPHGKIFPP